jgi:hypothetical protein
VPIRFDPELEVSPYEVFRRLKEGRPPRLVDVRPEPGALRLRGAIPYPGPDWSPPAGEDVVLIDDDGSLALDGARRMRAAGHSSVKALFGGLMLYEFALDPEVVGEERFLEPEG